MLITIENFGPIKKFEFDTENDLTLIFGKNSVGKSYAISLVYLILKNILELKSDYALKNIEFTQTILKNNLTNIEDKKFIDKTFINFINYTFVKQINHSITNTFNKINNHFSKKELNIIINHSHIFLILGLNKDLEIGEQTVIKNFKSTASFKYLDLDTLFSKQIEYYQSILISYNNVYYLPASRSGLYQGLNSFGAIFAELSKNRSAISKNFEIPALSEPVSDYYLRLSSIKTTNENPDFSEYVKEIEQEILQGKVDFDMQSKKIYFTPSNTTLKLDLSATSSMVSEIAPIVLYLKHILAITQIKETKQVPVLFIEEPEAHLHPETQVKLMRVFARLVKDKKIKLVMTSHSNYIFNAASNLVMDNKIPADKFEAVLFEMTEEGSVARPMATDEYGIDDDNFIDVAESLYEEKIELINKLNG